MIHLHNHTEYSLLDGASRIKDLVSKAKSFNMDAVAITDHGNLYGVIPFYKECHKQGIKPIIGCEFYYVPDRHEKHTTRYHLVLLAKNNQGYQNLIKLVSLSYSEGFYYKPRIDWELLTQNSQGLICLSACIAGEIPRMIQADTDVSNRVNEFKSLFGEDYYFELMDHGLPEETVVNQEFIRLSKEYNVPLVATNDTHYIHKKDAETQDILLCIGTKDVLSNPDRFRFANSEFYFKSPDEMKLLFPEEAILNTQLIADKCDVSIEFSKILLPQTENADALLRRKSFLGLRRISTRPSEEVMSRLEYELKVISDMGFSNYFLIVQDIISWAKSNDIPVGPGRGSAAGSLVAYLLGITEINPLQYGLMFERFLNPSRISMPDIDVDVCQRRRGEVVGYISQRYEHVAQIITFGTLTAKAAIRDVGRVLEEPLFEVDRLSKRIDSLEGATDSQLQNVINVAQKIEGIPRHTGVHAAGVIIGNSPLSFIVPTQIVDGQTITQYEMSACEELGLLKMDILGLKNLTIINDTIKLTGKDININKVPLDDKKVYRMLSQGHTVGIFQVESDGMQRLLKKLKPDKFEELIAMVALYRPGPLGSGMVDDFIDCKHGKEIKYLHPVLEPILKETYGVMLYQEQIMKITTDMAGFSLPQADTLRKGVGKKIPEVVNKLREEFINGSVKNGIEQSIAEEVFDLIEYFAGYGFNKSHSTAYAFIAYQTAWLKIHYPKEFMAALLTHTDHDKIPVVLTECRRMGIKVLPPEINKSGRDFSIDGNGIRFGLGAVKNLGTVAADKIIRHQPYADIFDFVSKTQLNKSVIETLIQSGCFPGKRKSLMEALPMITTAASMDREEETLFGSIKAMLPEIPDTGEYQLDELLAFEKEFLGFYLSSHPLDGHKLPPCQEITSISEGSIKIAGIVTAMKCGVKNGRQWCAARLEDYSGQVDVLIFNQDVHIGKVYLIQGNAKLEEDKYKVFARQAKAI